MELTAKQQQGLKIALERYKNNEKYTVISGFAGSGKAQPVDTIIPTPNGNKKLGDIKIGDFVFDGKGQPTKVLGVYPQGVIDNYKVTLEDGRITYCNNEHIFKIIYATGSVKELTIQQMLDAGLTYKNGRRKYYLPTLFNYPVQYSEKELKINPYTMGAFLGDGCCKEHNLTLSSSDEEIPKYIAKIEKLDIRKEKEKNGYDWCFLFKEQFINEKGRMRIAPKTEEFFANYKENLICYAYEKSIPNDYKYSSVEQRYELLQGLFDTDGSIIDNKYLTMRLTSTSLQLLNDVKEILYSLGYNHFSIVEDNRKDKYTHSCYDLYLSIPNEDKYKFFKLKRKKDIALKGLNRHTRTRHDKISIANIEKMSEPQEMVCIYVDNNEHLYLTNDYIITHNTTLVKYIVDALDVDPDKIAYCAYCGKAAEVLRKKGNKNAMTLHKLLYDSFPRQGGGFYRKPKPYLDYNIVIADECSMIPKTMIDMLLKHKVYILFIGDPFQLDVIDRNESHNLLEKPHIFLDQVMRQAAESEIIRLTMDIREGKPIAHTKGDEVVVCSKKDLVTGMLTWSDQIICATNATRLSLNNQMRQMLGYEGLPQSGEKMICLRNYWEDFSDDGESVLVNGITGIIKNPFETFRDAPRYVRMRNHRMPIIQAEFTSDDNHYYSAIEMDKHMIETGEPFLDWRESYALGRLKNKIGDIIPRQFTYGYAITAHKAQGSQFPKVLVVEESFPFDRKEHARWLYTACTRPEEKLVLIRS